MAEVLLAGLALMLVLEGVLPFVAPKLWREAFKALVEMKDGQIRFAGLVSIATGMVLLAFAL